MEDNKLARFVSWVLVALFVCAAVILISLCICYLVGYITNEVYGAPAMLGVLLKQPQKYWNTKCMEDTFSDTRKQLQDMSVHAGMCADMPAAEDDGEGRVAEAMMRGHESMVRGCAHATVECIYRQCEGCASYKY